MSFRLPLLLAFALTTALGYAARPAAADTMPISVIGNVETSPGVAATSCQVSVSLASGSFSTFASSCDADGVFRFYSGGVSANAKSVRLRIEVPGRPTRIVRAMVTDIVDQGFALSGTYSRMVDAGTIVVAKALPGAITGRVTLSTTDDYDAAVIGIAELGVFVQLNAGGYYLLPDVASGARVVTLYLPGRAPISKSATITPSALTTLDFISTYSIPPLTTR